MVLVGFTSLSVGSGTEQFLLNVVRCAPTGDFRVVVVQTDFAPSRRWTDEYVAQSLGTVELVTLRSSRGSLDPDRLLLFASKSLGMYALTALVQPFLRGVAARRTRRRNSVLVRSIESADLIYLVRNDDRDWLEVDPSRTVLVGSTHCDDLSRGLLAFGSLPARPSLDALYRKAPPGSRHPSRAIQAYHVTQEVYWRKRLKRTDLDAFIPLGAETSRFRPRTQPSAVDRIRFLFVGGLESAKGLDRLLDAWRQVASSRGELHIVGDGRLKGSVEERARQDPRLHFHGVLDPSSLTEVYRSCDVFLLPSRFETLGLVVLEALSSGLYVVASTAVEGVFDEFRDWGALEYLDMAAPILAARLQELSEGPLPLDEERRRSLHELLVERYDWKRVSAELFSWFEGLLARRGAPVGSGTPELSPTPATPSP